MALFVVLEGSKLYKNIARQRHLGAMRTVFARSGYCVSGSRRGDLPAIELTL